LTWPLARGDVSESAQTLLAHRLMKKVTGIGGIFFKVQDPDKLRDWYSQHLGIECNDYGAADFQWREAENPDCPGKTVWSPFPCDTSYFGSSVREFMINYRVANLDALLAYQGKQFRGFVLYQTFEPGDPSSYILAYHMGSSEASKWDENKNLVYDVAASIRCTKHLFPAQESTKREPKGSSKDLEEELSIKREEATMGFQNVYSPTTGEHWGSFLQRL
jgi:hypothetical protein